MSGHTRSGGTKVNTGTGTSQGCKSGNFCTAGKQGPGGTYTSTFDLQDNMTIDQINRGFKLDYGMDVDSHVSNSRLASCVNGNVMQAADCRDIVNLTVSLFGTGSVLAHKFEHELELDFTGVRNFTFSQTIAENTHTSMTGSFEMFGIDAGFGSKFFGPAFANPTLTTTFDLVTLIETEVIDIINNTDIISDNTPEDVQVETIEVEVETQDGQQMASLELEVNTEMTMEMELEMPAVDMPASTQEAQMEVTAEVSAEIETEMQSANTTDQSMEPAEPASQDGGTEGSAESPNESNQEPEQTAEAEPAEQEGEQTGEVNESATEESQEAEAQNDESQTEEESSGDAGPNRVADNRKSSPSNQKAGKDKSPKKVTAKKSAKQKAANKIVKKMGDKGRYDSTNQLKTLVIMNVLTDSKKFLVQPTIPQPAGFFTDKKMPDAQLPENNAAAWILMGGSNQLHDALVNSQYK